MKNEAWPQIAEALHSKGFIFYARESPLAPSDYKKNFEEPLNLASWVLRNELKTHADIDKKEMPVEYNELLDRLKKDGE